MSAVAIRQESGATGRADGEAKRRRVAVISSIAFSLSNFRAPLIRAMIDRGCEVYALAPDYDDVERAKMVAIGAIPIDFQLERAGINPLRDLANMVRLAGLLRRLKIDLAFSYFVKPSIYGTLAARLAGVGRRGALIAGMGYAFTPDSRRPSLARRVLAKGVTVLFRVALRFADVVFFQNDDDRDAFVSARMARPAQCVMLNGTGVDLSRFVALPPQAEPVTFLLMARLLREKGIFEYVEAARRLRRDYPDVRFLLLGMPDANPGSIDAATVAAWRDEGLIEWPGHVDDVMPWLADTSVYVLPSWREGAPRSTQEALALARPVVTTDAPGCRDTVVEGVNGFKVPVQDVDALTAAMRRFLDDASLIAPMGQASRELAERRYDIHAINARLLDALGL